MFFELTSTLANSVHFLRARSHSFIKCFLNWRARSRIQFIFFEHARTLLQSVFRTGEHAREFSSFSASLLDPLQKAWTLLRARSRIQFIFHEHAREEQNSSFMKCTTVKAFLTVGTHLFKFFSPPNGHITTRIHFSSFLYLSKSISNSLNWLILT